MKSRWLALPAAALVLAAALLLAGPSAYSVGAAQASHARAHAADLPTNLDTTTVLAQWGFGEPQNSYAWGMAWFEGKLYVGTGRDVVCVEKATTDFYYPFSDEYNTNPEPSVHCPKNPYDLDLRAEIWQYTPQTGKWLMVYRAPDSIRNPRDPSKRISPDIAYRGMTVVTGPEGRQALFVSGVSADEYIPELYQSHPPRILRTYDGTHFQNIVGSSFVVHRSGEFSDTRPMGFRGLVEWRHQLYVLASTSLTGDGAVFRINNPWSNHATFTQISPPWMVVFELQTFHGDLYFGAGNGTTGYSVWRLSRDRAPYNFQPIVTGGAGRGHYVTSVIAMQEYHGWLYVSAVGWYCITCDALPITEMIRINPSGRWQLVVGDPRFVPALSRTMYPISGLEDGFNNIFNSHMWRIAVQGDALYVGTLDWSWLLQADKSIAKEYQVLTALLTGEVGFNIWATCDGRDFFPVTRDAFGVDGYDFGVRTMVAQGNGFYVGSADHAHGTRIYYTTNACDAFPANRANRRALAAGAQPAPPERLLTDTQRDGTVLSWVGSTSATQYEVERAEYDELPFSFTAPPTLPGGFRMEGTTPIPAQPGSPGSHTAVLSYPGSFEPLATTRSSYFVDRTRRPGVKYLYTVVAESSSGVQSQSSNVQEVPDPRPPATFSQLMALLPARATTARDLASTSSCSRTLAELGSVARAASNEEVAELAYRLKRRLEYRNVAGGPPSGSLTCG